MRVRQTGHQFLFGCGAFDTVEIMKTQDEEGYLSFTGFKGSYRLETAKRQESFTLERDTEASVRLA